LGEVSITGLELLEESHILDGDNSLVGKGLEQGDRMRRGSGTASLRVA